jgi:UDP-glucuronate 4-epimerase
MTRVLVTGAAGLVGYHLLARWLEQRSVEVRGCDSFTSYYDVNLKRARSSNLSSRFGFQVDEVDLCEEARFRAYYEAFEPDLVFHLAAQPGVRQGISQPHDYVNANLVAFANVLDMCRRMPPKHFLYASSSSIYGANTTMPWSEEQTTVHPVSLYAATKMANELMAHSYSHLTQVPMTGLRFFTVYGEWGRPDMAPYKFTEAIRSGKAITVFNHGRLSRDFTYVGDVIDAIDLLSGKIPVVGGIHGVSPVAPHRVVNIGSGRPVTIAEFIEHLEKAIGIKANIVYGEKAPGDVVDTFASVERLLALTGYRPKTTIADGLQRMCDWHRSYGSNRTAISTL